MKRVVLASLIFACWITLIAILFLAVRWFPAALGMAYAAVFLLCGSCSLGLSTAAQVLLAAAVACLAFFTAWRLSQNRANWVCGALLVTFVVLLNVAIISIGSLLGIEVFYDAP